jgi:hypothetical protein
VAIAKKRLEIQYPLYTLLQILELNLFGKKPIVLLDREALKQTAETPHAGNRLNRIWQIEISSGARYPATF